MKNILYIAALSLLLIGCTNEENNKNPASNDVELGEESSENIMKIVDEGSVNFIDNNGKVKITVDKVSIITEVTLENLNKNKEYTIFLDNGEGGVLFSTESNAEVLVGEAITDTNYKPDSSGNLKVTMKNPIRIVAGVKKNNIIVKLVSEKEMEIIKSNDFTVSD